MAVCNLFNELTSPTGNFLMFSQYVEDITHGYTAGDNWKIVPDKFIALNIDYSNINTPDNTDLNISVPKYFQNCFENVCAYDKNTKTTEWTPEIFKNIFWNSMFDGNLLTYIKLNDTDKYVPEIMYYTDINMHAYNEHQGMGYGEIYCYIPTDAKRIKCTLDVEEFRTRINTNTNTHLEGFNTDEYLIEGYNQEYSRNSDFKLGFDNDSPAYYSDEQYYNINTIVVTYSIMNKVNDAWETMYSNIPMGIYFAGNFNDTELSNPITKHVDTSYDTGTSYGLRICTRFTATKNGSIVNTDIITDDSELTSVCQMMTGMNENLYKMMDIAKSAITTSQEYKDTLSAITNNRTNVPYVKNINGLDYWFVNGKMVSPTRLITTKSIDSVLVDELNYEFTWNK